MTTRSKFRFGKITLLIGAIALIAGYSSNPAPVGAFSAGPPAARTGAPGETTCAACHNQFAVNSGTGSLTITGVPATYTGGQDYTITVTITQTGIAKFGFETTAIDFAGKAAGVITLTDAARTQLKTGIVPPTTGNTRTYIQHNAAGNVASATDKNEWSFKWTAPPEGTGKVTFYVAGNATNSSSTNQGDYIYTINAAALPPTLAATGVSAATYSSAAPLTAEGIVALFGPKLATQTVIGNDTDTVTPGIQLPKTLGGTSVKVKDSANVTRDAPLFFVSPLQVNYQVPADTANGAATVTVTAEDGTVSTGTMTIAAASPGLFSFDATGKGAAVGYLLRVKPGNIQTIEQIAQNNSGTIVTLPIDLGPATDQLFLVLYGTGIRGRSSLSLVSSTIGGLASDVLFAGAQPDFVGLDQINIRIPRTVTLSEIDVELQVESAKSNKVKVRFKPAT